MLYVMLTQGGLL
jgi:hypothetical protein